MRKSNRNWTCCIEEKLFEIGLGYIWDVQNKIDCIEFFPVIKQRLIDISVQSCQEQSTIPQSVQYIRRDQVRGERRGGVEVERSPLMREIGVRFPVATDPSRKNR